MAKKKYCNRCAHEMWYDETAKRWYCTNKKCVKYKDQPKEEPAEEAVEEPVIEEPVTESPKQEETPVEQPKQDSTDTNSGK